MGNKCARVYQVSGSLPKPGAKLCPSKDNFFYKRIKQLFRAERSTLTKKKLGNTEEKHPAIFKLPFKLWVIDNSY